MSLKMDYLKLVIKNIKTINMEPMKFKKFMELMILI